MLFLPQNSQIYFFQEIHKFECPDIEKRSFVMNWGSSVKLRKMAAFPKGLSFEMVYALQHGIAQIPKIWL